MSPAGGRWSALPPLFRTQGHSHPRSSLRCVSKAQSKGAWLFPKPAIRSPAWPAGLRGEIKEEAAAVRRMPGDIRPEGLRGAPDPSGGGETSDPEKPAPLPEIGRRKKPRTRREIGRAHV